MATFDAFPCSGVTVTCMGVPSPIKKIGDTFMCDFYAAHSKKKKNKTTGKWDYGPSRMMTVKVWGFDAEYIASTLQEKDRVVIVDGDLEVEEWDDKNNPGSKKRKDVINCNSCVIKPKFTKGEVQQQHSKAYDPPSYSTPSGEDIPF